MPHIGIDVSDLLRPHRAGMARYTQCLLDGLRLHQPNATLHAWASKRRVFGWPIRPKGFPLNFFGKNPSRTVPDMFHATACVFPAWKSPREIATVHDLFAVPKDKRLDPKQFRRKTGYIYRADRIICVSHFTRNHLHELLPDIPESRTVAIPLAASSQFTPASDFQQEQFRRKRKLPSEFLLFVGRDRPNKNLDRLVVAYAVSGLTLPLYIAGKQSSETRERLSELAKFNHCKGQVRWLGTLSDEELPVLLSCASAVCMPSTFEGFGLPVIEAMACNTPVLTSTNCATEEAAGDHAVLIEPKSIDSIAHGLERVLQMTDVQRNEAGSYARGRTWKDVAAETLREYEVVIERSLAVAPA